MKYLSNVKLENKRVLLRCDFNVPIIDNEISDNSKIIKSIKTIKYLLENNNTVIIFSHFGRVKKESDKMTNSLKIVYEELKKYIDVEFIANPLELEQVNKSNKKCFLVENTRFTDVPEKKESTNDLNLAKYWSNFGNAFVIDAFGSLHRAHASTAGISKYLPTYLGFLVEEELNNLDKLINVVSKPFTVIMGGAKVDDKIQIIETMMTKCDYLILTGGILNTFLKVMGYNVGKSLVSNDPEIIESIKRVLNTCKDRIRYSETFGILRDNKYLEVNINEIKDDDIIYDNIITTDIIKNSNLIFFNGACGKFENLNYQKGTKKLLNDFLVSDAQVYIGGGDTVSAVTKFGYDNSFTYLSSGGGATLEYVAYGKLKALEYIKNNCQFNKNKKNIL